MLLSILLFFQQSETLQEVLNSLGTFVAVLLFKEADWKQILLVILITFVLREAIPYMGKVKGKWPTLAVWFLISGLFLAWNDLTEEYVTKSLFSLGLSVLLYNYVIKVLLDKFWYNNHAVRKDEG